MNIELILTGLLVLGVLFLIGYLRGYDKGLETGRLIERALSRGGKKTAVADDSDTPSP
jgi:hypothetical protein